MVKLMHPVEEPFEVLAALFYFVMSRHQNHALSTPRTAAVGGLHVSSPPVRPATSTSSICN